MNSIRTVSVNEELAEYIEQTATREDDVWRRLRQETSSLPAGGMQIGADQARLLGWLVRLIGARRTLEIGTFTGASALAVAQALPEDGRVVACDVSDEWTSIARRYWIEADVRHKIDLRLGPALDTLSLLAREGAVCLISPLSTLTRNRSGAMSKVRWPLCGWAGWLRLTTRSGVAKSPIRRSTMRIRKRSTHSTGESQMTHAWIRSNSRLEMA